MNIILLNRCNHSQLPKTAIEDSIFAVLVKKVGQYELGLKAHTH